MVALVGVFAARGGRDPAVVGAAPWGGEVDLFLGVDEAKGLGEILGEDGYGVAGCLEL